MSGKPSIDGGRLVSAAHALVGLLYAQTLFTGLPGGDAGELAAMSCVLGVAHPPGYPLLVTLVSETRVVIGQRAHAASVS